jgi:hypothetical protein
VDYHVVPKAKKVAAVHQHEQNRPANRKPSVRHWQGHCVTISRALGAFSRDDGQEEQRNHNDVAFLFWLP